MDAAQALTVVRSLANGVDPESGEVFPPESAYQRPQVVRALYEAASAQVRSLYEETDPVSAHDRANRLGIDYLIVGVPEQRAYPQIREVLRSRVDLFREAFHRGDVSIFYVER